MFNPASNTQLAALLFGGTIKEEIRDQVPKKNGQGMKTQITTITKTLVGLGFKPIKRTTSGAPSTDEESLIKLKEQKSSEQAFRILTLLLKQRQIKKLLSTYYNSTVEMLYNDDKVRPQFNHVDTSTGRLSSKNPNIQNQPRNFDSLVKEHFVSRFKDGVVIEADFAQIEIAVQAQLSGDTSFIKDVLAGVDFHTKRLALKENLPYETVKDYLNQKLPEWVQKRSEIKGYSFALPYGAGPTKIAELSGLTVEEVKDLMIKEDEEYPQRKLYNEWLKVQVEDSKKDGIGYYDSLLGRTFCFVEYDSPDWLKRKGIYKNFMPTEIKNYIIQGTAFDILATMVGRFWREKALLKRKKYLLIATIHDSIVIDCRKEYIEECKQDLKEILTDIPNTMKKIYGIDWVVPIGIDIKVGRNWHEC